MDGERKEESKEEWNDTPRHEHGWEYHTKDCKACRKSLTWMDGVTQKLKQTQTLCQVLAAGIAFGAAAASMTTSANVAVCLGAVAVLMLAAACLVGSAAAGVENLQRGYVTGAPSTGNPMVDLYPHEKTGDKSQNAK
eukprot:scaffold55017_cov47-Prasinocladus_malaysianus.AAC.1